MRSPVEEVINLRAPSARVSDEEAAVHVCGGHSAPTENVPDEVIQVATAVKGDIQAAVGCEPFTKFVCHSFTQQVVAGMNYKMSIEVHDGVMVDALIFKPLPHTGQPPRLTSASLSGGAISD
jgi:hypothetical protein